MDIVFFLLPSIFIFGVVFGVPYYCGNSEWKNRTKFNGNGIGRID